MEQASLTPLVSGEVGCPFQFPDLEIAIRGHLSAGPAFIASRRAGAEVVRQAIAEALAPYRKNGSGYRQRARFRYVIAAS